jgi:hypothetical protein
VRPRPNIKANTLSAVVSDLEDIEFFTAWFPAHNKNADGLLTVEELEDRTDEEE